MKIQFIITLLHIIPSLAALPNRIAAATVRRASSYSPKGDGDSFLLPFGVVRHRGQTFFGLEF